MRKLWAIASITVRSAFRSRVVLTLGMLLLAVVIGLPLTIQGDGTLSGHVQILLRYSLGASFFLLGMALVWAGCASISSEIRDRQIHLVATKPVHPLTIWLGKWCGLLAVQTVLFAFAGAGVYGLLLWTTRDEARDVEDEGERIEHILVASQQISPQEPDVESAARAEVRRRFDAGDFPPDMAPEEALAQVRQFLRQRAFSVAPGGRTAWEFRVPFEPAPDRPAYVQFRFEKSVLDMEPVRGRWVFGEARVASPVVVEGAYRPQSIHRIAVPPEAWDGSRRLQVAFEHTDPVPAGLLFDPDEGVVVRLHRGGFAANYGRALLILFFRLAFLSALGLAAGTLFSLPVAAFASVSFMLFVLLHDYIEAMAMSGAFFATGGEPGLGWVGADHFFTLVFRVLAAVVQPLRGANPLDWLAAGRWVSIGFVGREFLVQMVVYGGGLALICAALFRRRELGLPT